MNILGKKKKESEEKMDKLSPVVPHNLQVRKLAFMIFDSLKSEHKFGEHEKFLLGSAALLHDIGISKSLDRHHKISQKMISKIPFKFLDANEVKIIGNICRYHRKAYPNEKHKIYNSLNNKDKNIVRKLSAILRVADGLDRAHSDNVESININKKNGKLIFTIQWKNNVSNVDISGFNKKKSFFEQEFGKVSIV